jgi:hypothetical protein
MNIRYIIFRVLTKAYDAQDNWVNALCPMSGIVNTRKHIVSETEFTLALR